MADVIHKQKKGTDSRGTDRFLKLTECGLDWSGRRDNLQPYPTTIQLRKVTCKKCLAKIDT